jgi:RES domain-containing protein
MKVEWVKPEDLPEDWRNRESGEQLQAIGADWIKRNSSAVLAVPSSVIPAETNYLLNPLHPSFKKIEIGEAQEFLTDLRLPRT